ncbi:MarR family winged helix-turn-helix transcriptional regulator [Deinococcus marmoris]|uniref:Transcriptional regulator, MarR family n=1 Tax=Deinococcus marmoris TaxID=249408 RepID=A0A1U7NSB6_9DEIO|nr:MarR family transcriptional regulator [Deinococcus marmoris]OLV15797.1 Transcriptional regulator, MarR family [Deinococcus marmoris]
MNAQLSPRPPEVQLWVTLDRVYTILSRNVTGKVAALGLTAPQYRVLRQLRLAGDATPPSASELAERLGVTPGNLTGILDRLEADGLLARERSGPDRRSLRVRMTPDGAARMEHAVPELRAYLRGVFAPFDAAELGQMQELLERLELHLESPGELLQSGEASA